MEFGSIPRVTPPKQGPNWGLFQKSYSNNYLLSINYIANITEDGIELSYMFFSEFWKKGFARYVTLKWQSQYEAFVRDYIPEIMDLNVLPSFRKTGVGSILLDIAEKEATTKSDLVSIGVGLYAGHDGGYGSAQKLYVKRGYVPDGRGVTYNYQPTIPETAIHLTMT